MNHLRELRVKKGLTQLELSKVVKVSEKTVSAWELGKRNPKPRELQKLEDFFNIPKEKIFFNLFSYKM
ncbi:helix-turn-helix transcriptional regulator [Lactiplantibacillus plantarum]|uniref:helix-turn-helix transcriptional regulator n=1 Tax=Lactiplantibacillus plantarum TaxID=1590 RepID=UPI001BAB8184|nr:helix-turn-helix transcriptional regulator [Lactiplantibacillus plantarum]MBS0950678.1 helix-turn-helix transcriptional regulator [Lactiplantibacillus plantarum]